MQEAAAPLLQSLHGLVWLVYFLFAIVVLVFLRFRYYKIAKPDEAMIISGFHHKGTDQGFKIVTGRGVLVKPFLEDVEYMSLHLRETELKLSCFTKQGVPITVEGICIYKVGDDAVYIANASRRFLNMDDTTFDRNVQHLFEGHARSIIGSMTVEEIVTDPEKLSERSRASITEECAAMGLKIDSLQIKEVKDSVGYIEKMSRPHVAKVEQIAATAKANESQIAIMAEQTAAAKNQEAIRDTSIKTAKYKAEVAEAEATAAQAGPLAKARAEAAVITQQTEIQKLQAQLKEQQLYVEVIKPAEAEASAVEKVASGKKLAEIQKAEGEKAASIARAEAEAVKTKLSADSEKAASIARAEAEASKTKLDADAKAAAAERSSSAELIKAKNLAEAELVAATKRAEGSERTSQANALQTTLIGDADAKVKLAIGTAEAQATTLTGEANATATRLALMAEADGLEAKGKAMAANKDAVIEQRLVEIMPELVRAAAQAFSNVDNFTVLNGAEGLQGTVAGIISSVPAFMPLVKKAFESARQVTS